MTERYDSLRRIKTRVGIRYEAYDRVTCETVLLQRLPENVHALMLDEEAFQAALDALPQLRHPNLVPILDLARDADGAFAATEKVEGKTLTEWLVANGTLQLDDLISVATDCLQGLEAMEHAGVCHGDVEPDKILLKRDAESRLGAILTDPGLARLTKPRNAKPGVSDSHLAEFVSPEEIRGLPLDIRSDLYTLACTLYYSFSSVPPFQGKSRAEVLEAHLHGRPMPICERRDDMPAGLGRWLMAMLATNSAHRPQTAARALVMLHVAASQPSGEIPIPPAQHQEEPPSQDPTPAPKIPAIPVPRAVPAAVNIPPPAAPVAIPRIAARPPTAIPPQPTAVPRATPRAVPASSAPPIPGPAATPAQQVPRATPRVVGTPAAQPVARPAQPGIPTPRAVPGPKVTGTPHAPRPGIPTQRPPQP